jgi:hypothetical protein
LPLNQSIVTKIQITVTATMEFALEQRKNGLLSGKNSEYSHLCSCVPVNYLHQCLCHLLLLVAYDYNCLMMDEVSEVDDEANIAPKAKRVNGTLCQSFQSERGTKVNSGNRTTYYDCKIAGCKKYYRALSSTADDLIGLQPDLLG